MNSSLKLNPIQVVSLDRPRVVSLGRSRVVSLDRSGVVSLNRSEVVSLTVPSNYFSNDKKNEVAKKCIENANGAFNSFPKDLRQSIKDELGKNLDTFTKVDFADFQVLIDKLKSIIDGTEVLHKEEITTKNIKKMSAKSKKPNATSKKAVPQKTTIKRSPK